MEQKTVVKKCENEKKALEIRINKIVGQLNGVKQMILDDRYCNDILIQLSAIDKSIKSLASVILDAHVKSCILTRVKNDELEALDEIADLFRRFL